VDETGYFVVKTEYTLKKVIFEAVKYIDSYVITEFYYRKEMSNLKG